MASQTKFNHLFTQCGRAAFDVFVEQPFKMLSYCYFKHTAGQELSTLFDFDSWSPNPFVVFVTKNLSLKFLVRGTMCTSSWRCNAQCQSKIRNFFLVFEQCELWPFLHLNWYSKRCIRLMECQITTRWVRNLDNIQKNLSWLYFENEPVLSRAE